MTNYTDNNLKRFERLDGRDTGINDRSLADNINEILQAESGEESESIKMFAEIISIYHDYHQTKDCLGDPLGLYLEESGQANPRTGQFFTPMSVSDLMVELGLATKVDDFDYGKPPQKFNDPTCGSGRLAISIENFCRKHNKPSNYIFYGIDISYNAFNYATMNMIMHHIPSIIIQGDTLRMDFWRGWAILPQSRNGIVNWYPLSVDKCKEVLVEIRHENMERIPVTKQMQLEGVTWE